VEYFTFYQKCGHVLTELTVNLSFGGDKKFVQLRADGLQVSGAFLLFIKKDAFNYT